MTRFDCYTALAIGVVAFASGVVTAKVSTITPSVEELEMMSFQDLVNSSADAEYKWYAFLYQRGAWGMCAQGEEQDMYENRPVCVPQPIQFYDIK